MVAELREPGSDQAVARVPQHPLGGHEELGLCPASLLLLPLSLYDARQLEEMAQGIERLLNARASVEPERQEPSSVPGLLPNVEPYRPGRIPRPDKDASWFKPNPGGKGGGQTGYPPLRLVQTEPPTTGGSAGVTSAESVKALISRALELEAEAKDSLFITEGKLAEALQLINIVREGSSDSIGAPEILQSIEMIGEAGAKIVAAMEAGQIKRGAV
jgi:hypothetical protein